MPITDKTRKILWGRSGNRCAICKRELVVDATPGDDESVVGDECHIISSKPEGPRNVPGVTIEEADSYQNLVLLCKIHHKIIDDQVNKYPASELNRIKHEHESWVQHNLGSDGRISPIRLKRKGKPPAFLPRVSSGKLLFDLLFGTACYLLDNDEPATVAEAELIGGFLQYVSDVIDIVDDISSGDRVQESFSLNKKIQEIEEAGFIIFAGREDHCWVEGGIGEPTRTPLLSLVILRNSNPAITTIGVPRSVGRNQDDGVVPAVQAHGPNKDHAPSSPLTPPR